MPFILCLPRRGDAFAALDHCKGRGREAALFAQQCYFAGGAAHVTAALRRLPPFSAECVCRAGSATDLNNERTMGIEVQALMEHHHNTSSFCIMVIAWRNSRTSRRAYARQRDLYAHAAPRWRRAEQINMGLEATQVGTLSLRPADTLWQSHRHIFFQATSFHTSPVCSVQHYLAHAIGISQQ